MVVWQRWVCGLALLFVLPACDDGGFAADAGGLRDGGFTRRDAGPEGTPPPPPEMELEIHFEPPAVGESVLYATNRAAGRVAVIHADDFSIETVAVGPDPEPALAAPGRDLALSIQRAHRTVSVLRTEDRVTRVSTLPIEHDVNRAAFDPTGRFAVLIEAPEPGVVRRNLHDVSVVDLGEDTPRVVRAVVGYGPSAVAFDPAGTRAFVVTEDGVSTIALDALSGAGSVRAPVLGFDTLEPVREALVSPDGAFAVARVEGDHLRQLDLSDGSVIDADLSVVSGDGGPIDLTDVDIAPSGDEILAVVRSHSLVMRLPIGVGFGDTSAWTVLELPGPQVGSLAFAGDGTRIVGYTTDPSVESITVVDLVANAGRIVPLRKSVRGLAVSPDGAFALALHHVVGGTDATGEDALVDASHGYSVVDLSTGFARLALVDAPPQADGAVLDSEGGRLLLALRDDDRGVRELQVVDLASFAVDRVPLVAPPTTVGVFGDLGRAFIGQEADGGRVTFYLWGERETHTVAGFELAARVRR